MFLILHLLLLFGESLLNSLEENFFSLNELKWLIQREKNFVSICYCRINQNTQFCSSLGGKEHKVEKNMYKVYVGESNIFRFSHSLSLIKVNRLDQKMGYNYAVSAQKDMWDSVVRQLILNNVFSLMQMEFLKINILHQVSWELFSNPTANPCHDPHGAPDYFTIQTAHATCPSAATS